MDLVEEGGDDEASEIKCTQNKKIKTESKDDTQNRSTASKKKSEMENRSDSENKRQTKMDPVEECGDDEASEIKCTKNKKIKTESKDDTQNRSTASKKKSEMENRSDSDETDDSEYTPISKENNKIKEKNTNRYMCTFCSKTYSCMTYLTIHEQSHTKERERLETCPQCGLKLFNKQALDVHLITHDVMRVKKFKCEFCEKAYYASGALNVHRRIHLGTMIPCPICPKKFYRSVDLIRHKFAAHSAATVSTDTVAAAKIQSKYYAYCKICKKSLRTSSWRAHQASHLKDPLMQCSICDKDFFSRPTCVYHMQRTHNLKAKREYEPFIIYFKGRFSHLLMQQQCELQLGSAM